MSSYGKMMKHTGLMKTNRICCGGCETEHEAEYIYGKCKRCEEQICELCSYDTTGGMLCVKCGFSSCRELDDYEWCEARQQFIPNRTECELIAETMTKDRHNFKYEPTRTVSK